MISLHNSYCHGELHCLLSGSHKRYTSFILKTYQKIQSYFYWQLENRGLRGMLRHMLLRQRSSPTSVKGNAAAKDNIDNDEVLHLRPGEWVEVKSIDEVMATLDDRRRNRGLLWMTGMRKHCGHQYRVLRRVERIILESNGELRKMKNTVLLDGVMCNGSTFNRCDRSCFHFWREVWLRRVPLTLREQTI